MQKNYLFKHSLKDNQVMDMRKPESRFGLKKPECNQTEVKW